MRALLIPVLATGFLALTACGGGGSTEGAGADAGGDPEEVICCEFGGAKGTATRGKCLESEGKVHPKADCP